MKGPSVGIVSRRAVHWHSFGSEFASDHDGGFRSRDLVRISFGQFANFVFFVETVEDESQAVDFMGLTVSADRVECDFAAFDAEETGLEVTQSVL
jgi:hypothetical protein